MVPVPDAAAHHRFLALIRGEARGPFAALARFGLWLLSLGYGVAVRLRNLAYSRGWVRTHRVDRPVISVGNLSVGGTGKTPCVEYVADFFRGEHQVAILSRGYGAQHGPNDEALVLEENLPDVPHLQGPDRVDLANRAIEELESDVLVLDDGFQHRRLARDLDLVLIDATDPWGLGHLLPRGLLREPLSGLRRADAIILTRCDQGAVGAVRDWIARRFPGKPIAEAVHEPVALKNTAEERPLVELKNRPVGAFCGLGNPEAFRRTLGDLGATVADFRAYPDHHPYGRDDVEGLARWAESLPGDAWLVTTQKDFVKLRVDRLGGRPLWAVRVRLTFRAGQSELDDLLRGVMTDR